MLQKYARFQMAGSGPGAMWVGWDCSEMRDCGNVSQTYLCRDGLREEVRIFVLARALGGRIVSLICGFLADLGDPVALPPSFALLLRARRRLCRFCLLPTLYFG